MNRNLKTEKMIIEKRITVIAENDNQDILYEWIETNRYKLEFVSEDFGCGCCVSIFTMKGKDYKYNSKRDFIVRNENEQET